MDQKQEDCIVNYLKNTENSCIILNTTNNGCLFHNQKYRVSTISYVRNRYFTEGQLKLRVLINPLNSCEKFYREFTFVPTLSNYYCSDSIFYSLPVTYPEYVKLLDRIVFEVPSSLSVDDDEIDELYWRTTPCNNPVWDSLSSLSKDFDLKINLVIPDTKEPIETVLLRGSFIDLQNSLYVKFDYIHYLLYGTFRRIYDLDVKFHMNRPKLRYLNVHESSKWAVTEQHFFNIFSNSGDTDILNDLVFKVNMTSDEFFKYLEDIKIHLQLSNNSINYYCLPSSNLDTLRLNVGVIQEC